MRFLLVHSPLVGPATWRWVADALAATGHDAVVPDLRMPARSGRPDGFVDAAVAGAGTGAGPLAVVGHSGAGFFLPSIASRLAPRARCMVFVDAGLPPATGPATAGGDFLGHLRSLAVDGMLPRWATWWGDDAMATLVPDSSRRAEIEVEMPEVPLAFYESPVDLPPGWGAAEGRFLLSSEPYRSDAERAAALGWMVTERPGGHLDIVTDPAGIARTLVELAAATPRAGRASARRRALRRRTRRRRPGAPRARAAPQRVHR